MNDLHQEIPFIVGKSKRYSYSGWNEKQSIIGEEGMYSAFEKNMMQDKLIAIKNEITRAKLLCISHA